MITYEEIESNALHTVAQHAGIYEEAALKNTRKVMAAFRKNKVSDYYLKPATPTAMSEGTGLTLFTPIFSSQKQLLFALSSCQEHMPWQWHCWEF